MNQIKQAYKPHQRTERTEFAHDRRSFGTEPSVRSRTVKNMVKAFFILGAVENGWTVKKSIKMKNGVELLRSEGSASTPSESVSMRRCISEPMRIMTLR